MGSAFPSSLQERVAGPLQLGTGLHSIVALESQVRGRAASLVVAHLPAAKAMYFPGRP